MRSARDGLRHLLEAIVLLLMLSLALIVVVGVGFRKAGASLVWYDEVASILLAWLTYYGAALAALNRAHIAVPTLVERVRGPARTGVVILAEASVYAFFGVLTFAGVRVLTVLGGTTLVSLPWVPMWVAQSVIPIGAVLIMVARALSLPDVLAPGAPGSGRGDGGCPEGGAPPAADSPHEPRRDFRDGSIPADAP